MNAIIIAAGSGKRISKDVKSTPKSLINVNEKPIINSSSIAGTVIILIRNNREIVLRSVRETNNTRKNRVNEEEE